MKPLLNLHRIAIADFICTSGNVWIKLLPRGSVSTSTHESLGIAIVLFVEFKNRLVDTEKLGGFQLQSLTFTLIFLTLAIGIQGMSLEMIQNCLIDTLKLLLYKTMPCIQFNHCIVSSHVCLCHFHTGATDCNILIPPDQ